MVLLKWNIFYLWWNFVLRVVYCQRHIHKESESWKYSNEWNPYLTDIRVDGKLGSKSGSLGRSCGSPARDPQDLAAELVWFFILRWRPALSIKWRAWNTGSHSSLNLSLASTGSSFIFYFFWRIIGYFNFFFHTLLLLDMFFFFFFLVR